jgi:hypothetical protein
MSMTFLKFIFVAAVLTAAACNRSDRPRSIVVDGLAWVDGGGNVELLDASESRGRWLWINPDKAAKIPPEIARFRSASTDRCWSRVYGVRASGTVSKEVKPLPMLLTTSLSITRRYSDAEVPALLDRVRFQPLKGKHTCGSA